MPSRRSSVLFLFDPLSKRNSTEDATIPAQKENQAPKSSTPITTLLNRTFSLSHTVRKSKQRPHLGVLVEMADEPQVKLLSCLGTEAPHAPEVCASPGRGVDPVHSAHAPALASADRHSNQPIDLPCSPRLSKLSLQPNPNQANRGYSLGLTESLTAAAKDNSCDLMAVDFSSLEYMAGWEEENSGNLSTHVGPAPSTQKHWDRTRNCGAKGNILCHKKPGDGRAQKANSFKVAFRQSPTPNASKDSGHLSHESMMSTTSPTEPLGEFFQLTTVTSAENPEKFSINRPTEKVVAHPDSNPRLAHTSKARRVPLTSTTVENRNVGASQRDVQLKSYCVQVETKVPSGTGRRLLAVEGNRGRLEEQRNQPGKTLPRPASTRVPIDTQKAISRPTRLKPPSLARHTSVVSLSDRTTNRVPTQSAFSSRLPAPSRGLHRAKSANVTSTASRS